MARKYLLVEVTKEKIILLKRVKEIDRDDVLISKDKNQQLWSVKSFKDGMSQIENHNRIISEGVIKRQTASKKIQGSQRSVVRKEWDWSKVSRKKKDQILQYYQSKDYLQIFMIHNDLELTDENYCCDGYKPKVDFNIEKAIKDGIL